MRNKIPKGLNREILRLSKIGKHYELQDVIVELLNWAKGQGINTEELIRDVARVHKKD